MNGRLKDIELDEFKRSLRLGLIRPASLDDVMGTHHNRSLYRHPNTNQYYVDVVDQTNKEP